MDWPSELRRLDLTETPLETPLGPFLGLLKGAAGDRQPLQGEEGGASG